VRSVVLDANVLVSFFNDRNDAQRDAALSRFEVRDSN
jgi:hypothetical protein